MQFEETGERQKDNIMKVIDWQGKKESVKQSCHITIISVTDLIQNMVLQNIHHIFSTWANPSFLGNVFIACVVTKIQAHTSDAFLSEITVGNSRF